MHHFFCFEGIMGFEPFLPERADALREAKQDIIGLLCAGVCGLFEDGLHLFVIEGGDKGGEHKGHVDVVAHQLGDGL